MKKFIDRIRLHVKAGRGGEGYIRKVGQGGRGGNIYLKASTNQTMAQVLAKYPTKRVLSEPGMNASARMILGRNAPDVTVSVPIGITVSTDNRKFICNLDKDDQQTMVAAGGVGGGPKNNYCSQLGETHTITLDLKLIADFGLVGFPNAGKSTFLNAISRTNVRIGAYPFTTLTPSIATVSFDDYRKLTIADLPGLIEGAHVNVGLGHNFLKHVERTNYLAFIIDCNGFQFSQNHPYRNPLQSVALLCRELYFYDAELLKKPAICLLNKTDTVANSDTISALIGQLQQFPALCQRDDHIPQAIRPTQSISFCKILAISALKGYGMDDTKVVLRQLLDDFPQQESTLLSEDSILFKEML